MDPHREATRVDAGAGVRLALVAWVVYFAGRAPFVGQWDSFDYLKQITAHRLSDLGFGRPLYLAYNIALWETTRKTLGLEPLQVATVALGGTLVLGAIGVLLFHRVAHCLLPPRAARLASGAFLAAPGYALYSGYVMTEVPMLVALLAGVLCAVRPGPMSAGWGAAAGACFGAAIGIREQAMVWAPAFLWLLWIRRNEDRPRARGLLGFVLAAAGTVLAPILLLYLWDPAAFVARLRTWLAAIPFGPAHVALNVEASLLYLAALCPAAWLAAAAAGARRLVSRAAAPRPPAVPHPIWGVFCCLGVPVASLWRDADVQIHPRYLMIALPPAVVVAAALYDRWTRSRRAVVAWALLQVAIFGVAQAGFSLIRALQAERRAYVELLHNRVPGEALLVGGGMSPVLDYYRVVGNRPGWRILWSGWAWSRENARAAIDDALRRGDPVYICDGPAAWLNFEGERLDVHYVTLDRRLEPVAPGLIRVW